jgi:hypothetical protein
MLWAPAQRWGGLLNVGAVIVFLLNNARAVRIALISVGRGSTDRSEQGRGPSNQSFRFRKNSSPVLKSCN